MFAELDAHHMQICRSRWEYMLPIYRCGLMQVRMGFGLHVGWAIEGAIGSEYKIDASYLSPNVNMASRLEAATKQFGTTILLSEDVVCMLSPFVRSRVRQIDCVTVKVGFETLSIISAQDKTCVYLVFRMHGFQRFYTCISSQRVLQDAWVGEVTKMADQ